LGAERTIDLRPCAPINYPLCPIFEGGSILNQKNVTRRLLGLVENLVALTVLLTMQGCVTNPSQSPDGVLAQYIFALESNNPARAYELLDPALQQQITRTKFFDQWKNHQSELVDQLRILRRRGDPIQVQATMTYPEGEQVRLVRTAGVWTVHDGIGLFLGTTTPYDTLKSLIQAIRANNLDALLKLLSREKGESLEKELHERLMLIEKAMEANLEVMGNKAVMVYGPSLKIELVFEDGQWKISDFN
jgi:hypothetical protein